MRSKRRVLALALLSSITFTFAEACAESFKVGVIIPLSGSAADYGEAIRNSIELARRESPEKFTNIQFIYEDGEYNTQKAVSAFQKLRTVDKVNLVYPFGILFCRAIAPLAEATKTPMAGQCIDEITTRGRKYIIRFMDHTDAYATMTLKYLETNKANKIAVLLSDNGYVEQLFEAFQRNLSASQSITVIDRYPTSQNDFRSTILKVKNGRYDAVGIFLVSGQISTFYRQLRELSFSVPTFGTNFFESLSEVEASQGAMDGAVFANNAFSKDFERAYRQAYPRATQLAFGACAYEFADLTAELFGSGGAELSPDEVIAKYSTVTSRVSKTVGEYHFQETTFAGKEFTFSIAVKRVKGNSWEVVD